MASTLISTSYFEQKLDCLKEYLDKKINDSLPFIWHYGTRTKEVISFDEYFIISQKYAA